MFFLIFFLIGCEHNNTNTPKNLKQTPKIQIDTSVFVILPLDTTWVSLSGKPADLTTQDLIDIERLLKKCVEGYNVEQEKQIQEINHKNPEHKRDKKDFVIDLTRYKRQYMATRNSRGEKVVWINCFCDQWDKHSRTSAYIVMDGGNCYFNLKVNLTQGTYSEMMVNGEA
jgi:hypothetical protein